MELKYIVDIDNIEVKDFLKLKNCSRNLLKKIRLNDMIFVNGVLVKNYYRLNLNDELVIKIDEYCNDEILPNDVPLEVLYEDEYLLIVLKNQEIASHPSQRHQLDNLLSIVKNYYNKKNINTNMHIVTRLDFSTSGIVIIAKIGLIHYELSKVEIIKKYLCLVHNKFDNLDGEINKPIKRMLEYDIRRCVAEDGKNALTLYKVLKNNDISLVEVTLKTGRTHQIRVHMASINHPVVGDKLYGLLDHEKLKLHCYYVKFIHPITKEEIEIKNYPSWYKED